MARRVRAREAGTHPAFFPLFSNVDATLTTTDSQPPDDWPLPRPGSEVPPPLSYESETFQHYQVLRREDGSLWELGRGAMGVTYKAFDTNLRCHVALKVISSQHLHSEIAGQRFIREARIAARLRHRNIAAVYHLGVDPQGFFYSMEFIDGETLECLLERVGPLPLEVVLRIALQTARALAAAARQGLIHRDIKPANLMVLHQDEDGEDRLLVKVIDFGLARSYDPGDSNAQLTATGFVGTPLYASPEQLEEKDLDVRSDIYSLGITLWILFTGHPPFDGKMTQVITQHLSGEPPWWQLGDCPAPARALLERMLKKDPADRFQSASELRLAVSACLRSLTGQGDPDDSDPGPLFPLPEKTGAGRAETVTGRVEKPLTRAGSITASRLGITGKPSATVISSKISARAASLAANWRKPPLKFSLAGVAMVALCAVGTICWHGSLRAPEVKPASILRAASSVTALQTQAAATTLPDPAGPVPRHEVLSGEKTESPAPPANTAPEPPAASAASGSPSDEGWMKSVDLHPPVADPSSQPASASQPSESPSSATASPATPAPSLSPTVSDHDNNADKGSGDAPAKSQQKTSSHARSHHSAHPTPTPHPNFLQKLFGIKPKPGSK